MLLPAQVDVGELTHTIDVGVDEMPDGRVTVVLSMPARRRDRKGTKVVLASETHPTTDAALDWIVDTASVLGRKLDAQAKAALKAKGYRIT